MNCPRLAALVLLSYCALGADRASAQELSRYRGYTLESSVASVLTTAGMRDVDTKTLHVRPTSIQEIEWRAPYVASQNLQPDPVHSVRFAFVGNQLYKIVVTYHRDRMEGLTVADVTDSLSASYGAPVPATVSAARGARATPFSVNPLVLARWENEASLVTLVRNDDSQMFQLVLVAKALEGRARAAIVEAARLDAMDAPQREAERRKKEAEAASIKREEARTLNKAGFRP